VRLSHCDRCFRRSLVCGVCGVRFINTSIERSLIPVFTREDVVLWMNICGEPVAKFLEDAQVSLEMCDIPFIQLEQRTGSKVVDKRSTLICF